MSEQRKTLGELVLEGAKIYETMVFAEPPAFSAEDSFFSSMCPIARQFYTVERFSGIDNWMDILVYEKGERGIRVAQEKIFPDHFRDIYIPELSVDDAKAIMAARFKKKEEEERALERKSKNS